MAKILVVDDSKFQRINLRYILKQDGHTILEAGNGREALEIIATDPPDCVLLDIIMPEMDGLDVLMTLRDKGIEFPIIMVTADIQETTRQQCLELGAVMVINKPQQEDNLRELIRRVLEAKKGVS